MLSNELVVILSRVPRDVPFTQLSGLSKEFSSPLPPELGGPALHICLEFLLFRQFLQLAFVLDEALKIPNGIPSEKLP